MLGLKIASVVKSENLHTLALTWFITAFTVLKQLLILRLIKRQTNCEFKVSYCECNNNYSKGQTPFNPTVSVSKHFELLKNKVTVTKSAVLSEKGLARTRRLSLSLLKLILAFSSLNTLMCLSPCVNIHLIMPLMRRNGHFTAKSCFSKAPSIRTVITSTFMLSSLLNVFFNLLK